MPLSDLGQVEVFAGLDVFAAPDRGALGHLLLPLRRPRLVGQPAGCNGKKYEQGHPSSHAVSLPRLRGSGAGATSPAIPWSIALAPAPLGGGPPITGLLFRKTTAG